MVNQASAIAQIVQNARIDQTETIVQINQTEETVHSVVNQASAEETNRDLARIVHLKKELVAEKEDQGNALMPIRSMMV